MTERLSILLVLGLTLAGCGGETSSPVSPTPNPTPNPDVTFSTIQRDIFERTDDNGRAACSNCHTSNGRSPAGGLDLSHAAAYDQLVYVSSRAVPEAMRVIPGEPDRSYLVRTIEGTPGIVGRRMPPNGPYLTEAQISIVRQWIALGAPRN